MRKVRVPKPGDLCFQFLVVLAETDPIVWRRLRVPHTGSFWDLHVALQDAMGWKDCHLHEFEVFDSKSSSMHTLSIPTQEMDEVRPCLPSWRVTLARYLDESRLPFIYRYDFGDDWRHFVSCEGVRRREPGMKLPCCVSGARACPPEDCGGSSGYLRFLEAISDRKHPEHKDKLAWVGGKFDPDKFDPASIRFDDPIKRWEQAFGADSV